MDLESASAGIACLPDAHEHITAGSENCFVGGWGDLWSDGDSPDYAQPRVSNI